MPRLSGIWGWLQEHRDLGFRYLAEGTSASAAGQLRSYGIGILLGLAALGYVQAATTLMGPITILFLGMGLVLLPEAARILRRSPQHLSLFCVLVSAGLAAASLTWGVVLLVVAPRGFGAWLLGPIWRPAYPLILPQMLFVTGQAVAGGAGTGLHALGAARRSLRVAIVSSVLLVACALAGAAEGGAVGTVRGSAVAAWLGALLAWWQLRAAIRESDQVPADHRFWPGRKQKSGTHRVERRSE